MLIFMLDHQVSGVVMQLDCVMYMFLMLHTMKYWRLYFQWGELK